MNVDVEDEGDGSDQPEIKTIRIVNSENEEKFMYEMCSTILKSAAALARHKMSIHGSDDETCIYMFELHFGYYLQFRICHLVISFQVLFLDHCPD